jgi:hypothetical protein
MTKEVRPELPGGLDALACLLLPPVCVGLIGWLYEADPITLAALVLAAVLSGPLCCAWLARRRTDPLSVAVVFIVLIVLGYLLPLPSFLEGIDKASLFVGYVYHRKEEAVTRALWLAAGGSLAFLIPLVCFRVASPTPEAERDAAPVVWSADRLRTVGILYTVTAVVMFLIGVVIIGGPAALLAAQSDRLRAFSGINFLLYAVQLCPIFALLWWMWMIASGVRPGLRFWIYVLLSFGVCALEGSKLIIVLMLMAGVYIYHVRVRPFKARYLAIAGFLTLVGASAYDLYFREYAVNHEIASIDLNVPIQNKAMLLADRALGGQFIQIQMLSIIVDGTPGLFEYEHGATFIHAVTFIVPRALWPDKPTTNAGRFAETLRPDIVEQGTTFPPSMMGEFYWNFGDVGVIVGMLAVGCMYRGAERAMLARPRDPCVALPCAFFWSLLIVGIRGSLPDIIAQGVFFILPAYFAARYVVRPRRIIHSFNGIHYPT